MFAENRIQGLISREPVPLDQEQVKVFDEKGALVVKNGEAPMAPALSKSYPLYDNERIVGQLEVSGSLRGLVYATVAAAVLGLLLGVLVFTVMRVVPLRALRRVTDALFDEKERAETTLKSISDAVITTDRLGHVQYLNPTAEHLLGTSLLAVKNRGLAEVVRLIDGATKEPIEDSLYRALSERRVVSCKGTSELCRPEGMRIAVEERSAPILDQEGMVAGGVMILRDVSVSREYNQRRSWEATHDLLTGLVNRREFENRLRSALTAVQASGPAHVVCYMDLDRFKVVNDSCGHAAGDELLIQITRLMQARIRDTDALARLGGDEFGVLLEGCDTRRAQLIAAEILAAVRDYQFAWKSKLFTVGISIGLTAITAEHMSVAEVLGEADSACYWAKEQGRNRVCVYLASDMDLVARRSETGWVARINAAFEEKRFVLYHQDYRALNSAGGGKDHLEVLLRMIGEGGEIIAPGHFLPAAERYNLMPEIDRWVVHSLFSRYHELVAERGGTPLTCAINLSGASINSDGFLDFVRQQALRYELPPGSICFELTETVAVNNLQAAAEFIRECKAIGFQFALDDFGTGTSSFGYLKKLPVDYLKIDGGFVKDIEHDRVDQAMTETINRIGHIMGMRTIAEYAENEAIIDSLQAIGVDFAQGYGVCLPKPLFAPPVVSGDFFADAAL
jgi:diguanylate cyclase (GGDEF)-like protein/PAS domain S-box-containing protein